ncbi:MAG: SIR2 family NAD-dependent protein deacylase [Planctomycetota bacterium]|jgi:NAD-dependent deacetylase
MNTLTEYISRARRGVAFTGAGISTESGIPDFRSPGGVWSREKPVMYDDFMSDRSERVRYWKMREEIYKDTLNAKPNEGHLALAELQRRGHLCGVITQNIDGLHQDAGSDPVIELHGTNRIVACQHCGQEWKPEVILARIDAGDDAPVCEACGGPIKSKTISFGQAMPRQEMEAALDLAVNADLLLAMGSSLVVEPAASFPRYAKQAGATLVIVNNTATPLDDQADLVVREPIGETMRRVLQQLGESV